MMAIDVRERLLYAVTDREIRRIAHARWVEILPTVFTPRDERTPPVSLRASDAGQCVRRLWNEIHGNPAKIDAETQLSRFDIGTVYGSWMAALLATQLERDKFTVQLEPHIVFHLNGVDVSGHIDVYYEDQAVIGLFSPESGVVEFKTTYWGGELSDPADRSVYQIIQGGTYAMGKGADEFHVTTFGPAVAKRQGIDPNKLRDDVYKTSDWTAEIALEWARLAGALGDAEPPEDVKPNEKWRCRDCQALKCQKNPRRAE